jgi:hypothetical protein
LLAFEGMPSRATMADGAMSGPRRHSHRRIRPEVFFLPENDAWAATEN